MAGDAPKARALLRPGSGLTPRLLQTKLSAWPRPDPPSAPSPPQPILAEPLHPPAAAAAAAATAAPSPDRNPHPGEAAALRAPGLRKGLGMERELDGMGKRLENGKRTPMGACQCAPRDMCLCCSVSATAWVAVWTCVRGRVPPVCQSVRALLNACMSCVCT